MRLQDWILVGRVSGIGLAFIVGFHHGWQGLIWFVPLMWLSIWGVAADAHMRWEELLKKMWR